MKGEPFVRPRFATRRYVIIGCIAWLIPLWIFETRMAVVATVITVVLVVKHKPWTKEIPPAKEGKKQHGRTTTIKIKRPKGL